jgi:hypothetical protein
MIGSRHKILGSGDSCYYCLPDALSASFWPFLNLKANHVRKNEWLSRKNKPGVRLDKLYRLVPKLTPLDFSFLRYHPLTDTRWSWYGGIKKKNFQIIFFAFRVKRPREKRFWRKKLGSDDAWVS